MENKKNLVEALLFLKGESSTKKYIKDTASLTDVDLDAVLAQLRAKYSGDSGIILIETETDVAFGTNPALDTEIDIIDKKERGGELSKASLETLSIILYKNGATRSEIDYVRGVNSSFILRNLYIRGLIEKKDNEKDSRSYIYTPTIDTLRFLGIDSIASLPEYTNMLAKINDVFISSNDKES